jgi:hypothetical protein
MDQFGQNQFAPGMKSSLFFPISLSPARFSWLPTPGSLPAVPLSVVPYWDGHRQRKIHECENGNRWQRNPGGNSG